MQCPEGGLREQPALFFLLANFDISHAAALNLIDAGNYSPLVRGAR